jgi:hypothetical protein
VSREKSENLLAGVVIKPKASVVPQSARGGKEDYLFRNAPTAEPDAMARELRSVFEGQMSVAQMRQRAMQENSGPAITRDSAFNNRVLEHKRRHTTPDGDLVVWCAATMTDEPGLRVRRLSAPVDPTEKIVELKAERDEFLIRAVFRRLTLQEHKNIEPFVTDTVGNEHRLGVGDYRMLLFCRCFKEWNVPVQLNKENGLLTAESVETVKSLNPRLIEEIGDELITLNELQQCECDVLKSQSKSLFDKNSDGVKNACDGIREYCELTSLVKEIGVDLERLSWRDANALRIVLGARIDSEKEHIRDMDKKNKQPARRK